MLLILAILLTAAALLFCLLRPSVKPLQEQLYETAQEKETAAAAAPIGVSKSY